MVSEEISTSALRRWREQKGYTQEDVSGLTGYSVAMVSLIERGKRSPSPEAKVRIARRLGVPVGDIFPVVDMASLGGDVA